MYVCMYVYSYMSVQRYLNKRTHVFEFLVIYKRCMCVGTRVLRITGRVERT